MVFPDFEEYFETLRKLAGEPREEGVGRRLPKFDGRWYETFMKGHERRKEWWRRQNEEAKKKAEQGQAKL
jgi:hypothetical protein